ncbi:hypothetical protein N7492_008596 [Penicillium capsulatum]|uniref:Cobalamin-independent methionine synthase MetE C-terminal/archaeal domain-containing protein n=1 Tax=Penicillium capsulatum TaxID=69766 RepID=A0A9W9HSG5_9EURO|nr:hypothetical protein N7492_008596 [Penicillium capsulatum]
MHSSANMSSHLYQRPPFRAEHVGSLPRPQELLRVKTASEQGQVLETELATVEDREIKIVDIQHELGYSAISDGEYRRHSYFLVNFFPGLDGFDEVTDFSILNLKITLAAPNWYHLRYLEGKAYPDEVHGSDDEYFGDIAKAYRAELKILYEAGCRNVQYDDPSLALFCSAKFLEGFKKDPLNKYTADDLFEKYIKLYNDSFIGLPEDMHLSIHLCRGNGIYRKRMCTSTISSMMLEAALNQVGVSPQCGFASHREGNAIDWDGMINKLKLVRAIANDIWSKQP